MKRIFLPAAAVIAISVSMPCLAAVDPLARADAALKEKVLSARSEAVAVKAAPVRAQHQAPADYCVGRESSGAEGMPEFFSFHCTGGVKIPFMRRWCWTGRCLDAFAADMKSKLTGAGYELAATFHFNMTPASWNGYPLFKKAGSPREDYCLALRQYSRKPSGALYSIDCGDGAVVSLDVIEPGGGTSTVDRYMAQRGYEAAPRLASDDRLFSPLLFRKK